jgi:hypothetical protein
MAFNDADLLMVIHGKAHHHDQLIEQTVLLISIEITEPTILIKTHD